MANLPVHPNTTLLVADEGRNRVMFLPYINELKHLMGQGVIVATKWIYQRKFLEEVMVVYEEEQEEAENQGLNTQGEQTLQNLQKYLLKSASYNVADAWKDIIMQTLEHIWNCIWKEKGGLINFQDFNVNNFHAQLVRGSDKVSKDNVRVAGW